LSAPSASSAAASLSAPSAAPPGPAASAAFTGLASHREASADASAG
jgi:hypothetical protein